MFVVFLPMFMFFLAFIDLGGVFFSIVKFLLLHVGHSSEQAGPLSSTERCLFREDRSRRQRKLGTGRTGSAEMLMDSAHNLPTGIHALFHRSPVG